MTAPEVDTLDPEALFGLPAAAHQPGRIPKKLLVEEAASQTSDAALIARAVATAAVVAVLRPDNVKVPPYGDDQRRVDDIAVLHVELTDGASTADRTRLVELFHRSMPRPLILLLTTPREGGLVSLALTHLNAGDPDRATSVIDQGVVVPLSTIVPGALRLDSLNRTDLWAMYRDLVRVAAAAGRPASSSLSAERALDLRAELAALESELAAVARDAKREKSQAGRIRLNTRARELRGEIESVATSLYSPATADDAPTQNNR